MTRELPVLGTAKKYLSRYGPNKLINFWLLDPFFGLILDDFEPFLPIFGHLWQNRHSEKIEKSLTCSDGPQIDSVCFFDFQRKICDSFGVNPWGLGVILVILKISVFDDF